MGEGEGEGVGVGDVGEGVGDVGMVKVRGRCGLGDLEEVA